MTKSTIGTVCQMGRDQFAESNTDSLVAIMRQFKTEAARDAFVAGYIAAREADLQGLQLILGIGQQVTGAAAEPAKGLD